MTSAPPTPQKYQLMPAYTPEQMADLKEDIRKHGVLTPIEKDENGNIVDGHHRHQAFEELIEEGVDLPMYDTITRRFSSEEEKIEYVLSLNIKRRHMSPEQLSELCFKLKMPPFNYSIPKIAGLVGKSVGTVWNRLNTLDPEVKKQLEAAITESSDGRLMPSTYITSRSLQTGNSVLRTMQMEAIKAIGDEMRAAGTYPTYTPSTPANDSDGTFVPTPQIASSQEGGASPIPDDEAQERMTAFTWYGGKSSHLNWLLPLLPPCQHFVDVFGGSAAVLINRQPPSPIETYNDLDGNVVNFFKVLRDTPDELLRLLALTPFGREERRDAFEALLVKRAEADTLNPVERARMFFVMARQSRSGLAQKEKGELNSWKFVRDNIQRGLPASISQWESGIDGLAAVASRLKRVQIENYQSLRVIELYDTPSTLFYCDPPYVHDTRVSGKENVYAFEMSVENHKSLASALNKIKGRAAVSGYPSDLYDELYKDWRRIVMPSTAHAGSRGASNADTERMEVLWMNYDSTGRRLDA